MTKTFCDRCGVEIGAGEKKVVDVELSHDVNEGGKRLVRELCKSCFSAWVQHWNSFFDSKQEAGKRGAS